MRNGGRGPLCRREQLMSSCQAVLFFAYIFSLSFQNNAVWYFAHLQMRKQREYLSSVRGKSKIWIQRSLFPKFMLFIRGHCLLHSPWTFHSNLFRKYRYESSIKDLKELPVPMPSKPLLSVGQWNIGRKESGDYQVSLPPAFSWSW